MLSKTEGECWELEMQSFYSPTAMLGGSITRIGPIAKWASRGREGHEQSRSSSYKLGS